MVPLYKQDILNKKYSEYIVLNKINLNRIHLNLALTLPVRRETVSL